MTRTGSKSASVATTKKSPVVATGNGADGQAANGNFWDLRLYVAGQSPKSVRAFTNLKRICEQHLAGRYQIEVIDLMKNPQLAAGDQILAVPTLVRKLPEPIKKIIGDLSQEDRTLIGLDLRAHENESN